MWAPRHDSKEFATLPPHFTKEALSADGKLNEVFWVDAIPMWNLLDPKFKQTIKAVTPSILYHQEFLHRNLQKAEGGSGNHPLYHSAFWDACSKHNAKEYVVAPQLFSCEHVSCGCGMRASGVPASIRQCADMDRMVKEVVKLTETIQSLQASQATMKDNICAEIVNKSPFPAYNHRWGQGWPVPEEWEAPQKFWSQGWQFWVCGHAGWGANALVIRPYRTFSTLKGWDHGGQETKGRYSNYMKYRAVMKAAEADIEKMRNDAGHPVDWNNMATDRTATRDLMNIYLDSIDISLQDWRNEQNKLVGGLIKENPNWAFTTLAKHYNIASKELKQRGGIEEDDDVSLSSGSDAE
jgi:hypothetical protein